MINIIFLLIAGSALTYISKYNLELVTVDIGVYRLVDIPLFYVIVGSLLIGLVLSYLLQILRNISTYWEIRGKSREIQTGKQEILDLTKTVHQLELANEKLKHEGPQIVDSKAL
jgi:hypothetical protein